MSDDIKQPDHLYDRITNVADFVKMLGHDIYKSAFFGCVNEEQGRVIAIDCILRKVSPLERATTDHIIDGKLSMRADQMLALFLQRGGKVKWNEYGDDGVKAEAKWTKDGNTVTIGYAMEEARRAGLGMKKGSGWDKNPGSMLRARLTSKAVRMLDPGAIAGRYAPEELGEEPDESGYVTVANEEKHKPLNLPAGAATASQVEAEVEPVTTPTAEVTAKPATAEEPPTPTVNTAVATTVTTTTAPHVHSAHPTNPITEQQRHRILSAKKALAIPQDKWIAIVRKRGYESALLMPADVAEQLMLDLEKKVSQRELNAFADRVVSGTPKPAAESPATGATEQPPFDAPA